MGILILFSFWVSLFCSQTLFSTALTAHNGSSNGTAASASTQHAPPPLPENRPNLSPFRPSIAVIVGVLTTMFSITFLLLLYAKHCKRGGYIGNPSSGAGPAARRNSGIDRAVIESLPIFRFASLRGQKDGLECAVCLTRFEPTEVLRLLPKCKHAFHVECVDTWLDAHSTCPLCRYRVDPEDVLLIDHPKLADQINEDQRGTESSLDSSELGGTEFRRVSGRHSSAGERASQSQYSLQILVQRPSESEAESRESRRSLDSAIVERSGRKDGLLLTQPEADKCRGDRESFMRRFEHRIILSRGGRVDGGAHRRWSDLRPSDLLFLQSEMIISNSGRYSASSVKQQRKQDRSVINPRCMSEITGLSRFREK